MKTRLFVLAGVAIGFAIPAFAQQRDALDPQTLALLDAHGMKYTEAYNNNNAAALAALYTEDAVFITDSGPVYGRQAIGKWFADNFKAVHPKSYSWEEAPNSPRIIGTANNIGYFTPTIIRSEGEWSVTLQGKNGEAIPAKGYSSVIYALEGDDWKIQVDAWNLTTDSVLLINKSFAPQLAAEPSPTASASRQ
jgi:uncharacterized protein (TIGR02246 family)